MAGQRGAYRGVLGVQLDRLGPNGELLTGDGNQILLPARSVIDVDQTRETRTIAEVDEPCLQIPERTVNRGFSTFDIEFCATLDSETLEFLGAGTTYGDALGPMGIEPNCSDAGCFCTEDTANANMGFAMTIWMCKVTCDGRVAIDPARATADNPNGLIQGVRGYPRLVFNSVTQEPGVVDEEGTPETWILNFTGFPNAAYGNGPGGVLVKVDPATGAPAGPTCESFVGDTNVLAPVDCNISCADFPVGLDSASLALV